MSSIKKRAVAKELAKRKKKQAKKAARPKFDLKKFCFPKQYDFVVDDAKFKTAVCSRRCLAEDTLVPTSEGFKKIQDIKPGDLVYNEWGKKVTVKEVFDNGEREVIGFGHNKTNIQFWATEDHSFLVQNTKLKLDVKKAKDISMGESIKIGNYKIRGKKTVDLAYTLGKGLRLLDMSIIGTWTLESQKQYLAAVVDNYFTICTMNSYQDRIKMVSRAITEKQMEGIQQLMYNLTKTHLKIYDIPFSWRNKKEKELVVPLRKVARIVSIADIRSIIDAVKPYLRKNVNTVYYSKNKRLLVGNANKRGVKPQPKVRKVAKTYDIHVDSPTNLYQLANGSVTHNSGKTVSCAADLYNTASLNSDVNCLYITLNRKSAKRIIWKDLLAIVKEYEEDYHINHTELAITLSNGSTIYLAGAKDKSEIEKFRGMSLKLVYIDECQSFRAFLEELIDDVIIPCLYDQNGKLALIGTPGPVSAGFFYEQSHNDTNSNHKWTMFDNPWIKKKTGREPEDIIAEELRRRGVDESNPTHRRENLGEWVYDADALVFKFDKSKNLYYDLPGNLQYIMGVDVGWHDADAIAILGFDSDTKKVYLIEEDVKPKQGIEELVNKIKAYHSQYNIIKTVMDTGGLGKKIQEEIIKRHQININPAEKTRKFEFIELLNDDLRTARFQAPENTMFEDDTYKVQWDMDEKYRLKISNTYHSDITDAVLYAWRECYHYVGKMREEIVHNKNTDAYMDLMEQEEAERMRKMAEEPEEAQFEQDIAELDGLLDEW